MAHSETGISLSPIESRGAAPVASPVLRAVLCDENPDDLVHFQHLLARHPSIDLIGTASSFPGALEKVAQNPVDVLFLETAMQGASILADCALVPPLVKMIFVTKDPTAAVRAFEMDAVDYLLKPVLPSRLSETIRRLLRIEWQRSESAPATSRHVLIPFERGRRGVSLDSICVIQAFGNYTRVSFDGTPSEIVLRSLTKWESLLPNPPFVRVHRNAIVNLPKVKSLEATSDGSILSLHGFEETIPVSRRSLAPLRQMLFHSQ